MTMAPRFSRSMIPALILACWPAVGCVYDLDKLRGPKVEVDAPVDPMSPMDAALPLDLTPDVALDAIPGPPEVFPDRANPTALGPGVVGKADLVAYFPLDEQSGMYSYDATDNGNDCLVIGPAPRWRNFGFTRSGFSNAGSFQAELSEFLECALKTFPAIDDAKTISFWMRYDYIPVVELDMALVVMLNRPKTAGLRLEIRDARLVASNYGYAELVGMEAPGLGSWHHVVYTFDGDNHALILNNGTPVVVATANAPEFNKGPLTAPDARFRMGKSSSTVDDGLRGYLDDVRVYRRVLTPQEIASLYGGAP
jgi:hypothetical protein